LRAAAVVGGSLLLTPELCHTLERSALLLLLLLLLLCCCVVCVMQEAGW
jgi:hypothetical protein